MSWDPLNCGKKNKREKKKEKKRVEEISQDEKEKIRERISDVWESRDVFAWTLNTVRKAKRRI